MATDMLLNLGMFRTSRAAEFNTIGKGEGKGEYCGAAVVLLLVFLLLDCEPEGSWFSGSSPE